MECDFNPSHIIKLVKDFPEQFMNHRNVILFIVWVIVVNLINSYLFNVLVPITQTKASLFNVGGYLLLQ